MRLGMRLGSVLSEAGRNLATGTSRAALLATVFTALVGTLSTLDVRAVIDVLSGAAQFRAAGAAVQILQVDGGVDGTRCDALATTPGIAGSGALRPGPPLRALSMPSSDLTVWEVTPGLVGVLASGVELTDADDSYRGGVWLSADLARTLGAVPGQALATSAGDMSIAGVYDWPEDGRARTLGYSILAPVPATGTFDQCWAQIRPVDDDTTGLLLMALTGNADGPKIGQLNGSLGATYDAVALLGRRPTRPVPLLALAIGLSVGYAAVRSRRLQLAAALHARVPKAQLAWQLLAETAAWMLAAAAVLTAAVGYAATVGNPDPAGEAWAIGTHTVATAAMGTVLGSLLAIAATREKHLFRYFQNR